MTLLGVIREENGLWIKNNAHLVSQMKSRGLDITPDSMPGAFLGTQMEPELIQATLESLHAAPSTSALSGYIDLIGQTKAPFNPKQLIAIFGKSGDPKVDRAIISTIAQSGAIGAIEWLENIIKDNSISIRMRSLAAGHAADTRNPKSFLPLLREFFALFPFNALHTFYKVGEFSDINFLEQRIGIEYDIDSKDLDEYNKMLKKTITRLKNKYKLLD